MKTIELLNKVNDEIDDEKWSKYYDELCEKEPFGALWEEIESIQTRLNEVEKTNKRLRKLLANHEHLAKDVVTKLEE